MENSYKRTFLQVHYEVGKMKKSVNYIIYQLWLPWQLG